MKLLENPTRDHSGSFNMAWIITCLILTATFVLLNYGLTESQPTKVSLELPSNIGYWTASSTPDSGETIKIRGADKEMYKTYTNPDGENIFVFVGYYASQGKDKELVTYHNERLYRNTVKVNIETKNGDIVDIGQASFEKDNKQVVAFYWYDFDGNIMSSNVRAKLKTIYDGIFKGQTSAAIIVVYSILRDGDRIESVKNRCLDFIRELLPGISINTA